LYFYVINGFGQGDDPDRDVTSLSSAVCDAIEVDAAAPDDDLFDRIAFEFNSLYQALHIYETLNTPGEFSRYYAENRSAQIAKVCFLRIFFC